MYKRFHHISDLSRKYHKEIPPAPNIIYITVLISIVSLIFSILGYSSLKNMNDLEFIRNNRECIQWLEGVSENSAKRIYSDIVDEYGHNKDINVIIEESDHLQTLFKFRDTAQLLLGLHLLSIIISLVSDLIIYAIRKQILLTSSCISTSIIVCVLLLPEKLNIGINVTLWLVIFIILAILSASVSAYESKKDKEMISKLSEVYLYCTDKGVNGIAFRNESKSTYRFEVNYLDIKKVFTSEPSYKDGSYNNFHIITANASYSLGLDDNEGACKYILNAIETARTSIENESASI